MTPKALIRKRWRERNSEKVNAQKRRWEADNPDKFEAQQNRRKPQKKTYYQDNKQDFADRSLQWRTDNRERWNEISREGIARNPQRNADLSSRRRARMQGCEVEKVDRLAIYARDEGVCHICNKHVPVESFTLDHVIPVVKNGPHTAENLKVAHRSCNSSKRDRLMSEIANRQTNAITLGDNHGRRTHSNST